ncbi:unnamed protein product [Rotaria socialis]|uniref:Uncharacterized protein n=1 Tax=Rotaria socialis TaxID=392032 RepID=A0A819C5V0_9BILA|nr:unnamed protein product [Rotaria socialis]CAF3705517.1 unnamed protein product [Rotaria socialis]CAF3806188.1 unnamed protein product [Rotaria socialis]CAF4527236.1 unnamed protein product [Rotaria socialis]CAF4575423.1 unnamed protein product [Rotaria socialis]
MFLSGLASLKFTVSLFVLLIAVGIGSFLYLTLNTDFESQPRTLFRSGSSDPLKTPISSENLNQIMNTARQAWSIVNNNRAIVDMQTSYGNGIPHRITDPFELQSWASPPISYSSTINVHNLLKQRVVQFTYALQFTYGGSLDGKGAYLDRVTVIPSRISVAWGFTFNASIQIASVHNVGTRDDPIAAVNLELHYRLEGLNVVERTESFHVRGDGQYTHINA